MVVVYQKAGESNDYKASKTNSWGMFEEYYIAPLQFSEHNASCISYLERVMTNKTCAFFKR